MPDAQQLGGDIPRGVLVYGHLPLMIFRCCPMKGSAGCGGCDGRRSLKDRQGREMTVLCHRKQYSSLLNPVPLYVADRPLEGLDFGTAYFTVETREECMEVWRRCVLREAWPGERTNGPYYRRLR